MGLLVAVNVGRIALVALRAIVRLNISRSAGLLRRSI